MAIAHNVVGAHEWEVSVKGEVGAAGAPDGLRKGVERDGGCVDAVRDAVREEDGESGCAEGVESFDEWRGKVFRGGDDEGGEGLVANREATVRDVRVGEERVGADDVEVEMGVVEGFGRLLHEQDLAASAHPLALGVVEERGGGDVASAGEEMGGLVGVAHEGGEAVVLRVVALRAEVGRAVRVGVVRREGVRDEVVYTAHEEEVEKPAHERRAFSPAVGAEDFAHGAAAHVRALVGDGGGEFGEDIVEEVRVIGAAEADGGVHVAGKAGHDLMEDDVDAAHVLPLQGAEVVAGAVSHAAVGVHVLDDVADVRHAVGAAPVAHGAAEAVVVERGEGVHVGEAREGGVRALVPQFAEVGGGILAEFLRHACAEGVVIGKGKPFLSDAVHIHAGIDEMLAGEHVAELRFVGEEAGDCLAEVPGVMLPVRFVDRLDLKGAGVGREKVDVVPEDAAAP